MTPRARRLITAALVVGALAVVAHAPALRLIGRALVVEDPLAQADAIVVIAGGTPAREEAAATLHREGLAPDVVLSNQFTPERVRNLIALGARRFDYQGEARIVLEKRGVPSQAIVALPAPVKTTEAELKVVGEAARARGWRRVILVTSPLHSRRVKLVWSREAPSGIEGLVRVVQGDDFLDGDWWRKRREAEAVLHEYLGLAAIYLGISPYFK
ncbi:MAG TPA: YdcF family protein [Methylomirabilota bacterium]